MTPTNQKLHPATRYSETLESLKNLDGALRGGILRIIGEDRSQAIEWQAVEGNYVHDKVTIQRRIVGSSWKDATVSDVLEELRKGSAVAFWLRQCTRAKVTFESLSLLEPNGDAHLTMLPDDLEETFGPVEDRAEEILEAKYELIEGIDYSHGDLLDAACRAYLYANERLSGWDLVESAASRPWQRFSSTLRARFQSDGERP